jgi:hypothetical protein
MKLSDWAKRQGISYLTAYRWFKDGKLPVKAYQSDSGTIIIQDDAEPLEQNMGNMQSNDIMSLFLKKTVEFSKNNASVEDFAAYVLSTFSLKLNSGPDSPRYSRNKPKSEDIQKHFQQFLKPKGEKPKPNMFVAEPEVLDELVAKADNLTAQELVEEIHKIGDIPVNLTNQPEVQDFIKDLTASLVPSNMNYVNSVTSYNDMSAEGVISRNVELTPQLNYTGSHDATFSHSPSFTTVTGLNLNDASNGVVSSIIPSSAINTAVTVSHFKPTQKEIESAHKAANTVADQLRLEASKLKRGRKPSKNSRKKP